MTEYRRILLDGVPTDVVRRGDLLLAGDGREVATAEAIHLPPVVPSKIVAVHLNYTSRVEEFGTRLPAAPTYFHKPTSSLNAHRGAVVRPDRCKWLNYEGEIAIVIGRPCRNVSPERAGDYIAGYTIANDYGLHDFPTPTPDPCCGSRVPTRSARSGPASSTTGTSTARRSACWSTGS